VSDTATLDLRAVRIRPRSAVVLTLASLAGLVMFCWPLLAAADPTPIAHGGDAPFVFMAVLPVVVAIVLAEIGDDRDRFTDDRGLQAFAGSAPVTRASGKSRTVTRRRTKNNRLAGIGYSWAFTAAARPSPAREHYLRRRERGDGHPAALRHLFNRMLGQLHHCLQTGQTYDPIKAFPHATTRGTEQAAAVAA